MDDNTLVPVIAAAAAGIALVVFMALAFPAVNTNSNNTNFEKGRQSATSSRERSLALYGKGISDIGNYSTPYHRVTYGPTKYLPDGTTTAKICIKYTATNPDEGYYVPFQHRILYSVNGSGLVPYVNSTAQPDTIEIGTANGIGVFAPHYYGQFHPFPNSTTVTYAIAPPALSNASSL